MILFQDITRWRHFGYAIPIGLVFTILCSGRCQRIGVQRQAVGRSLGLEGLVVHHAWRFDRTNHSDNCCVAMAKMKVYISGPITGHDREQVMKTFAQHEQALQSLGHETVNPCRVWAFKYGWLYRIVGYRLTLLYDLWLLSRCDAIHVLPGSIMSRGCRIEQAWAENFKLKII